MTRIVAILLSVGIGLHALPARADTPATGRPDRFALSVKGAAVTLTDDEQTIAGSVRRFDDTPDNFVAIEGETRFADENVAVGGEFMRYSAGFRRASSSDDTFEDRMRVFSLVVKAKYFLGHSDTWQPYVGGGVGWLVAHDYRGPISGEASGLALQGVLGLQLRTQRVGVRTELFAHHGKVEDSRGDEIDASLRGVMLGVTFFFGPPRPR